MKIAGLVEILFVIISLIAIYFIVKFVVKLLKK